MVIRSLNASGVGGGNGYLFVASLSVFSESLIPLKNEADEDAHLLCADGSIFEIEKGGRATCRAVPRTDMTLRNFYVHV